MLAIEVGVREAARRLGLNEDRVRQWSSRNQWFAKPADTQHSTVTTVTKPADALQAQLATHEGNTRLYLAKYSANAAAAIHKSVHPTRYTKQANDIARTMAIVHKQDQEKPGAQFSLNVLNLNMFSDDSAPVIDT